MANIKAIVIILTLTLAMTIGVNAEVITIEAEDMMKSGQTNRAVTDGWALMGVATLSQSVTFTNTSALIQIIARGDYAGGAWPLLEVKIAGVVKDTISIDSAEWKTFDVQVDGLTEAVVTELSVTFINDYYVAPNDRNAYIDKIIITMGSSGTAGGSVTIAWDPNTEPDLKGYIIYYGNTSRYDPIVAMTVPSTIKLKCGLPDTGDLTESQQKCKDSWEKYCTCIEWQGDGTPTTCSLAPDHLDYCLECGPCAVGEGDCDNDEECQDALVCPEIEGIDRCELLPYACKTPPDKPDPACDSDYFKYAKSIDVKNVTEYTLTGLTKGLKYFLAATAYDDKYPAANHESKFSEELTHTVTSISKIINFRKIPSPTKK